MNDQLEQALRFAEIAKDITSLKSLARQESARADKFARLLHAALTVSGPIPIPGNVMDQDVKEFTVTLVKDGDLVLLSAVS